MRLQVTSTVRPATLHSRCPGLAKTCSIRTVGRKEQKVGIGLPDRPSDGPSLAAGESVHRYFVPRSLRRHKEALHIYAKRIPVDRSVEDRGGVDPADPQCGDERHGVPTAVWGVSGQAFTPQGPSHPTVPCWSWPRSR